MLRAATCELARGMGVAAAYRMAVGIDAVDTAERLCLSVGTEFPKATFFGEVCSRIAGTPRKSRRGRRAPLHPLHQVECAAAS